MFPVLLVSVFALAMLLSAVLVIPARRIAYRLGAMDIPGGRRKHDRATPRMGGLAIVTALLLLLGGSLVGLREIGHVPSSLTSILAIALGAFILMIVGGVDDARGVPARVKLGIEIVVVTGVVLFVIGTPSVDFGIGSIPEGLWPLSLAFTVLWVLTITNGYNLIDGLDGLSAGVGAITAGALAVIAYVNGANLEVFGLVAVAGALGGFLFHNRAPARIFMGDSGTLPIGFLLGILGVLAAQGAEGWSFLPVAIALGVPLADVVLAVARRFLRSLALVNGGADALRERFHLCLDAPPAVFKPDSEHLHHRLVQLGLGRGGTVRCLYVVAAALGVAAADAAFNPGSAPWLAAGSAAAILFSAETYLYRELRVLERGLLLPLFDLPFVRSRWTQAAYDLVVVAAAWVFTWLLLSPAGPLPNEVLLNAMLAGALMVILLRLGSVYQGSFRHVGTWQATRMATLAAGIGLLTGALLQVGMGTAEHPTAFAILFAFLSSAPLVGARVSFRVLDVLYQRRVRTGRRILLYGAGRGGRMALTTVLRDSTANYAPVGFLDDDPDLEGRLVEGYRVLGGIELLEDPFSNVDVDEVFVSTHRLHGDTYARLSESCARRGLAFHPWPEVMDRRVGV